MLEQCDIIFQNNVSIKYPIEEHFVRKVQKFFSYKKHTKYSKFIFSIGDIKICS